MHRFDRFLWPREVGKDDKWIMCLSHCVYLNVDQPAIRVHLPSAHWEWIVPKHAKYLETVKPTWAGECQLAFILLNNPWNCCHDTSSCPVAALCLSCFLSCMSRWVWKWQGSMAASPPPTSPSHTLTTSTQCGTSVYRMATGSNSTSATSAWSPHPTVNMITSRYMQEKP